MESQGMAGGKSKSPSAKTQNRLERVAEPVSKGGRKDLDQRVRQSKEVILTTTSELLSEAGFGGVSVDEVSRRSGVAKTTIYRHWPTRSALLLDTCSQMGSNPETPDTGSLKGDITALVLGIAQGLQSARWPAVLPSIIDAAERDPEIAELHSRLHAARISPFFIVIERGKQKGELSRSVDASSLIASVLGPLFYRRWFSRESLNERFVKSVVEKALGVPKK
jgi:AcrR family transcriptional regulator